MTPEAATIVIFGASGDLTAWKFVSPVLEAWENPDFEPACEIASSYLFEVVMRRYETRSTMMTSNRPLEKGQS